MKNVILLFSLFILTKLSIAQTTLIPDSNFEQALINLGYDNIIDGSVITANINSLSNLNVGWSNISNLTGIEDFIALQRLFCNGNQLSSIDISQNINLQSLSCSDNFFTSLDITNNINLQKLTCYNNQISNLDVSQNTNLKSLFCFSNQLTELNVTQNILLDYLICDNNQISSLDLRQNPSLDTLLCANNNLFCLNLKNGNNQNLNNIHFDATGNPNLSCIEVDDPVWSTANWTNIDSNSSFSNSCNNTCSVGINNHELSNLIYFPNPNNGSVTIELDEFESNIEVSLLNIMGQTMSTQFFTNTDLLNIEIIYPSGFYYLKLKSSSGKESIIKILKEK